MEKELVSDAWAMKGWIISYTPGILSLNEGVITFITANGIAFETPVAEIKNVKWPKLQMGYGVHFDVQGKTYKLTFIQPNGEGRLDQGLITSFGRIANGISAIRTLSHLKDFKAIANQWRTVIGG